MYNRCLSPFCLKSFFQELRNQGNHAADRHIAVDDFTQHLGGDPFEDFSAHKGSQGNRSQTVSVGHSHRRCHKASLGPEQGHHQVSDDEVGLDLGDVLLLRLGGSHKVKHRRRPLHGEQPAHKARQGSQPDLCRQGRFQFNPLTENEKVQADPNEYSSQYVLQELVVEVRDGTHGEKAHHRKRGQNRQHLAPFDKTPHADGDNQGHGGRKHS